jgi:hypothetical protein
LWGPGEILARQALYHLNHSASPPGEILGLVCLGRDRRLWIWGGTLFGRINLVTD